ncbi:MAG TPA: hypothetical protein VN612_07645 [Acidobacteriaceae bacterium]|nr:hypothetical protein [Acidobacteriaceae bacterium]
MSQEEVGLEGLLEYGRTFDHKTGGEDGETNAAKLAREYLRIRDRDGCESPLVANAVQAEFDRKRGPRNIIVKARQMGMTTWIAGRFFLRTITSRGAMTVLVAHTRDAAQSIFRLVQRFYSGLPEHLRTGCLKRSRSNVGQMVFPHLDSEFRVLSAADENAGRGLTVQYMHLSEVSRWPGDAAATLAGLRAALVPSGELVMESTPNGAHGCFYEEWQQAAEKGTVRHFFPWWKEPAYVSTPVDPEDLREDELALMREHDLTAAQIGFRRGLESNYRNLRAQEFAEDAELCFRTSGECCFDIDVVERRLTEITEAVEQRNGKRLHIFFPPQEGKEYIVAADPAEGNSDGDYAAVQVIELATGLQCAELRQHLRPLELTQKALSLAREYSTPGSAALFVLERNNHGHGVIAHLQGGEKYPNVYESNGAPGWYTNSVNKPAMIANLDALMAQKPELFRSRRLLEECRTFVTRKNGRSGAAHGAHDDLVMAMAIAQAVRAELLESGTHRRRQH